MTPRHKNEKKNALLEKQIGKVKVENQVTLHLFAQYEVFRAIIGLQMPKSLVL